MNTGGATDLTAIQAADYGLLRTFELCSFYHQLVPAFDAHVSAYGHAQQNQMHLKAFLFHLQAEFRCSFPSRIDGLISALPTS